MTGLFIVLEGIDGSGTSTQADRLKDYWLSRGEKAILSPEPSSGPIGNLIREILKQRVFLTADSQKFDEQMAYLFAADRHDHLYNDIDGVFPLKAAGVHVISTRYYFSSLAYNCTTPTEFEFVRCLNARFPNPDVVIYIDIPVEVSLRRLAERSVKDIYETREKLIRVSQNYQTIFANYSGLLLAIDGTQSKDRVFQEIVQFINTIGEKVPSKD
ncbi:MAG: dTMP kinase [Chloroflexaceae bacterium]|nr:dTMP kinase [Chloroflexaceae bacterium]